MLDGAVRWAAPELYYMPDSHEEVHVEDGRNIALSEHSDIYSFGSVMLQVSPSLGSKVNSEYLRFTTN
jgi:hypothetical protein